MLWCLVLVYIYHFWFYCMVAFHWGRVCDFDVIRYVFGRLTELSFIAVMIWICADLIDF